MKTFHLTVCCPDDRVNGTYEIWYFPLKIQNVTKFILFNVKQMVLLMRYVLHERD